jgi:hypothetical protein
MGGLHSTRLSHKSLYPAVHKHHGCDSPPQPTGTIIVMHVIRMLAQTNLESQSMAATEALDSHCFSLEMQAIVAESILAYVIYL